MRQIKRKIAENKAVNRFPAKSEVRIHFQAKIEVADRFVDESWYVTQFEV